MGNHSLQPPRSSCSLIKLKQLVHCQIWEIWIMDNTFLLYFGLAHVGHPFLGLNSYISLSYLREFCISTENCPASSAVMMLMMMMITINDAIQVCLSSLNKTSFEVGQQVDVQTYHSAAALM